MLLEVIVIVVPNASVEFCKSMDICGHSLGNRVICSGNAGVKACYML